MLSYLFFFFFQAEDGIRDIGVTGVQTCALPILQRKPSDQLISSPDNEVVRRLRRLAHRREPGLVLLEGPRVLAEAKAAGLEFELIGVREGDRLQIGRASCRERV